MDGDQHDVSKCVVYIVDYQVIIASSLSEGEFMILGFHHSIPKDY